ncbi:MAG: chorismate synthase [Pseudobdellovibrio sp.]|jgi:chorismate synthase|nr:chorismate synthase [Pseudobdellovibrio sp.]
MGANRFGQIFQVTSFGESHGPAYGVIIDGCPAGLEFSTETIVQNLQRRKPGQSSVTTSRSEEDIPEVLSGVFENKTLGTPICIIVKNKDQRSQDYDKIKNEARIGHADDTWKKKYSHVDHRGGGRSSGRETVCRVLAGSVAEMLCKKLVPALKVRAYAYQIGPFTLSDYEKEQLWNINVDEFPTRFPSVKLQDEVVQLLEKAKAQGESYGGQVETQVVGVPAGLGQPVFHKFKSDLASAMISIGATTAFDFGDGFSATLKSGQDFHKEMHSPNYGGIRGGITTGEKVSFAVGFKPTSSIKDVAKTGRHDPCIVPRAVPVVEAMTWLVLADHILWNRLDNV